jgi:hypothetical protein
MQEKWLHMIDLANDAFVTPCADSENLPGDKDKYTTVDRAKLNDFGSATLQRRRTIAEEYSCGFQD